MIRRIVETAQFRTDRLNCGLSADVDARLEGLSWILARNPMPIGALAPTKQGRTWLVRTRPVGNKRQPRVPVLWLFYRFDAKTVTYEGLDVMWEPNETTRL